MRGNIKDCHFVFLIFIEKLIEGKLRTFNRNTQCKKMLYLLLWFDKNYIENR